MKKRIEGGKSYDFHLDNFVRDEIDWAFYLGVDIKKRNKKDNTKKSC